MEETNMPPPGDGAAQPESAGTADLGVPGPFTAEPTVTETAFLR